MEMDNSWADVKNIGDGGSEDHQPLHLASVVERLSIRWSFSGQSASGNPAEAWENIAGCYWVFLNTSVDVELVIWFDSYKVLDKCMADKICSSS